jgi:hypothetical protein
VDASGAAWAVGYSRTPHQALVLRWSGTSWQMAALPSLSSGGSHLYSVAVSEANNAWAVGWVNEAGRHVPLTLRWNGSSWSRVPAAMPNGTSAAMGAVAVSAPDDAWAGGYTYVNGRHRAFIEHWDGARWWVVPFPRTPDGVSYVYSIAALPSGEAWAVGEDNGVPVVARWDGLRFNAVRRPAVGNGKNVLSNVVVRRADDVWVAGYWIDPSWGKRTLIQHWDGASWTTEATPNPETSPLLSGVAALPSGRLWAVGWKTGSQGDQTLALTAVY